MIDRDRLRRLERRATVLLRSAAVRRIGLVLGLLAIVALIARLAGDREEAVAAVRAIGPGGILLALAAMSVWQVAPIAIARRFGTPDAAGVWARAQLLKYVPVPASAVAGFVGSSVRAGAGTRASVGAMVRQTGALALGAGTLGLWAVGRWAAAVGGPLAWGVLVGAVLVFVAAWALALRDRDWRIAGATSTAGWAVAGLGYGFGLGGEEALLVGSAVLASWVAGQIIVPVPAGLGVRELTLVVLVQHAVGLETALVVALVARLVHTVADVLMASVVLARRRGVPPVPPASPMESVDRTDGAVDPATDVSDRSVDSGRD